MAIPSRRERRKARKRGRRRKRSGTERALRGGILLVVVALLVVGLGYGYFRYEWSKVNSAPCPSCVAAANGAPYNVLLVGSDSREGETSSESKQFGTTSQAGGQRSDTIKIVHVDPQTGTASTLSIPRDTFVTLSGMASNTQLSSENKINAAFANGPDALISTIQNTFGIPISHYVVINFFGLQDAVNALGGIKMDFPYPVRDRDCSTGTCYNNSGLNITSSGCQVLDGTQALALSRSRYYQYYADGEWTWDGSGDIGRITRQNLIISAALDKAKSTYNPIRLNDLLTSVVHDFSKDDGLSPGDLYALAERYHAFSGSDLNAYLLPTASGSSSTYGSVQVVQPQDASQVIAQFLGSPVHNVVTPPLDAYGNALIFPVAVPTTTTPPTTAAPSTTAPSSGSSASTTAPSNIPSFDPQPC